MHKDKLFLFMLVSLLGSTAMTANFGKMKLSGILNLKKGVATIDISALTRSHLSLQVQNVGDVEKWMKAKTYLGPVDAELDIQKHPTMDSAKAVVKSCQVSRFKKLPTYNEELHTVVAGQLKP